jgi:hypothetical protein
LVILSRERSVQLAGALGLVVALALVYGAAALSGNSLVKAEYLTVGPALAVIAVCVFLILYQSRRGVVAQ